MIIVTPGHYASAKGASYKQHYEYPETRIWAKCLMAHLEERGLYVGAKHRSQKIKDVNALCRRHKVSVALEIHFNSAVNEHGKHVGKGSETLYYPSSRTGKVVAKKVQELLGAHFGPDRGIKEGWYRGRPESGAIGFLERTACPAIIIEPQFIHLWSDIQKKRDKCMEDLAKVLLKIDGVADRR